LFKTYYELTKPGIIYGNMLTTIGGFLLASKGDVDLWLLVATLAGTALIIASGCVFNNYIDRGIDAKMDRTKKRATVSGLVSARAAITYATVLGVLGAIILTVFVNLLVLAIGLTGLFFYVVVYGWAKRRSVYGTLVGSIPGATPPVAGYCAVTGNLDLGAFLLFLILVTWQMPHFYAIAMYRLKDYKAAGLPVWPAVKGLKSTKIQILGFILAFTLAVSLLTIYDYAGWVFLVVMAVLGLTWFAKGIKGFQASNNTVWARQMFLFSLIVMLSLSVMLSVNSLFA